MSKPTNNSILRGIRPREVQDIVRRKIKEGWELSITGGCHVKLKHPSGGFVITALTGSGGKQALRSLEKNIRNIEAGRPTS